MSLEINDPEVVRREYETEERLLVRAAVYAGSEGPDPWDATLEAVAEVSPRRVLEVGCGTGEFARRLTDELGVEVVAVDLSPRMVELARARGVDAHIGDVQALPFADGSFDVAVAAWMLYHVPDLDGALAQLARALRPGGRLVAVTNSERHMEELWELVGHPYAHGVFRSESALSRLRRHFARVECRPVEGRVTFPDREAARAYVSSSILASHLADRVPTFEGPLTVRRAAGVLVAEKAEAGEAPAE